ncbi:hypothetical protein AALG83_06210 [Christensenellaceae bacterium 44-20]
MKKFLSLLLAVMLCCAVFVSCGKAEQEPEASPEPSVEVAASPSPTPEPRTEVGIPEELKFCEEPLYYGMTIEEIREIFGQEERSYEHNFHGNHHTYYIYKNAQCKGRQVELEFRIFNYDGLVLPKSYGLDAVVIRWSDVSEEQVKYVNEEIRPLMEKLYGEPDSVKDDGKSIFRLFWKAEGHDGVDIMAKLADGPEIKIESQLVRSWDSIGLKDEAAMYKESGKQGVTLENLNRLKEGMSFDQAEVLLGTYTAKGDRYTAGGSTYATFIWEDDGVWDAQIEIKFCDGEIYSIYSKGL